MHVSSLQGVFISQRKLLLWHPVPKAQTPFRPGMWSIWCSDHRGSVFPGSCSYAEVLVPAPYPVWALCQGLHPCPVLKCQPTVTPTYNWVQGSQHFFDISSYPYCSSLEQLLLVWHPGSISFGGWGNYPEILLFGVGTVLQNPWNSEVARAASAGFWVFKSFLHKSVSCCIISSPGVWPSMLRRVTEISH